MIVFVFFRERKTTMLVSGRARIAFCRVSTVAWILPQIASEIMKEVQHPIDPQFQGLKAFTRAISGCKKIWDCSRNRNFGFFCTWGGQQRTGESRN